MNSSAATQRVEIQISDSGEEPSHPTFPPPTVAGSEANPRAQTPESLDQSDGLGLLGGLALVAGLAIAAARLQRDRANTSYPPDSRV